MESDRLEFHLLHVEFVEFENPGLTFARPTPPRPVGAGPVSGNEVIAHFFDPVSQQQEVIKIQYNGFYKQVYSESSQTTRRNQVAPWA